jgi:SecD/SecF fusion protein
LSTRLFYVLAAVAVVFTVAGVLVFQSRSGDDDAGSAGTSDPVLEAKVRVLQFYDWEANVLGPDGRPAPADPKVTGGPNAGRAGAISLYDAVLRAAKRPAEVEADNGRQASIFYAVDRAGRRVRPGATSPQAALTGAPAGSKVYEVKPGTAIVRADAGTRDRYYVIRDDVAITGSEVRNPRQGTESTTGRPVTLFDFTATGLRLFRNLTKTIAARGSQIALDAGAADPTPYNQHFAVVYEGALVTVPFVDFSQNPDGIDASAGAQLAEQLP